MLSSPVGIFYGRFCVVSGLMFALFGERSSTAAAVHRSMYLGVRDGRNPTVDPQTTWPMCGRPHFGYGIHLSSIRKLDDVAIRVRSENLCHKVRTHVRPHGDLYSVRLQLGFDGFDIANAQSKVVIPSIRRRNQRLFFDQM